MSKFKIEVNVDSKKGETKVIALGSAFTGAGRKGKAAFSLANKGLTPLKKSLTAVTRLTKTFGRGLLSLKGLAVGAFAAWGLKRIQDAFIATGSAMDNMRLSLDTITKGKGAEWFERLNKWALKSPINTAKAIKAFIGMRAMGLKIEEKGMTTLADTASAIGGGSDTLESIARALGQIQTKGRVSSEELIQLAERGIPAFEILAEKMHLTGEQVSNIGKQGLDAGKAIEALFEGMVERYGGQSEKIQWKWSGMIETMKSYWTEFQRLVMDAGAMEYLEGRLKGLIKKIDRLSDSGQLKQWAQTVSDVYVKVSSTISDIATNMVTPVLEQFQKLREEGRLDQWIDDVKGRFVTMATVVSNVGQVLGSWVTKAAGVLTKTLLPALGDAYDKAELWYWMNDDLIKSTLLKWVGKVGNAFEAVKKWLSEITSDDLKTWANTAKDSLMVVFKVVTSIAKGIDAVGKAIGWTMAKAAELADKTDKIIRDRNAKHTVEFMGQGSSIKPLSEKIAEMQSKFSGFADSVGNMNPNFTIDATGATGALANVQAMYQDLYSQQLSRVMLAAQNFGQHGVATDIYSAFGKKQASNQLQGAQAGLDFLRSEMSRDMGMVGGGSNQAPSAAGSRSVSVGELHIHLPAEAAPMVDQDWRETTRKYILPELEALN